MQLKYKLKFALGKDEMIKAADFIHRFGVSAFSPRIRLAQILKGHNFFLNRRQGQEPLSGLCKTLSAAFCPDSGL